VYTLEIFTGGVNVVSFKKILTGGLCVLLACSMVSLAGCGEEKAITLSNDEEAKYSVFWSLDQAKSLESAHKINQLYEALFLSEESEVNQADDEVKETIFNTLTLGKFPGLYKSVTFKIWNRQDTPDTKTTFSLSSDSDWVTFRKSTIEITSPKQSGEEDDYKEHKSEQAITGLAGFTTVNCNINLPEDCKLPLESTITITPTNGKATTLKIRITFWVGAGGSPYNGNASSQPADIIPSGNGINSWDPSIALDSKNNPHIVWRESFEENFGWEIFYVRWNGSDWVCADGSVFDSTTGNANVSRNNTSSSEPVMVLDSSDSPHIVWYDWNYGKESEILYVKWDSENWVCVNGDTYDPATGNANVSKNRGSSQIPDMALDSFDNPHITWADWGYNDNAEILYIKWNGESWVCADGSGYNPETGNANVSNNYESSRQPSLALDFRNNPHIVWDEYSSRDTTEIFYTRWDGTEWVCANGIKYDSLMSNANISRNIGQSFHPSVDVDSMGNPHVVWFDYSYKDKCVLYSRWDGYNWVCGDGSVYNPITGNADISLNYGWSGDPAIVIDSLDNPHVTWENSAPRGEIDIFYIRMKGSRAPNLEKWLDDDYSWICANGDLYDPDTGNANISVNGGSSGYPAIALDSDDLAHIVWFDDTYGDNKIFYIRCNNADLATEHARFNHRQNQSTNNKDPNND
jgi:hypothetical protein